MDGPTRKIIRATREITVNIHGEEFDALLIPRNAMVEVDFGQHPEDDPMRRGRNVEVLTEVDLILDDDVKVWSNPALGEKKYRLTETGAKRLLEAL